MMKTQEMLSRTVSGMRTQPPAVQARAIAKPSNVAPDRTSRFGSGRHAAPSLADLRRGRAHLNPARWRAPLSSDQAGSCPLYAALGLSTAPGETASDLIGAAIAAHR